MQIGFGLATSPQHSVVNPATLSPLIWYDPGDRTTMFQDTGRTSVVTADGQSVLGMADKGSLGAHMSQATSSKAPLWKTANGQSWLQVNGVDQFMSAATVNLSAYAQLSLFLAVYKNADDSQRMIIEHSANATTTNGCFAQSLPDTSTSQTVIRYRGATTNVANTKAAGTAPLWLTSVATMDLSASVSTLQVNFNAIGTASTATGGGNFSSQTLYLFSRAGTSLFFSGRLASLILLGRIATQGEIDAIREYQRALVQL